MTDAPPAPGHSSGPPHSGPACGNCGAAVAATDVICPVCDALLAAYQAPAGASPVDAAIQSISTPVLPSPSPQPPAPDRPSSTNPATTVTSGSGGSSSSPEPSPLFANSSPPLHQPRTMSPIGDALDRIEERGSSIGSDVEIPSSDDVAAELSKMAENDSELAKEVEARLQGAKVRFDGASPTIETQPDLEPETDSPVPAVVDVPGANRPGSQVPIPSLADVTRHARQGDRRTGITPPATVRGRQTAAARPLRPATTGQADDREWSAELAREAEENAAPVRRPRRPYAGKVVRAVPFVLILLFLVLGFDRTISVISAEVIVGMGMLIVIGLVVAASRVGRKTTSMARDDQTRTSRKPRSS